MQKRIRWWSNRTQRNFLFFSDVNMHSIKGSVHLSFRPLVNQLVHPLICLSCVLLSVRPSTSLFLWTCKNSILYFDRQGEGEQSIAPDLQKPDFQIIGLPKPIPDGQIFINSYPTENSNTWSSICDELLMFQGFFAFLGCFGFMGSTPLCWTSGTKIHFSFSLQIVLWKNHWNL